MKVTCHICGKQNYVSPSGLRFRGITPETYKCKTCFLKQKRNYSNPNWSYYRALIKIAKEVSNE